MAKKKTEEEVEETTAEITETEATEEVAAESNQVSADAPESESTETAAADADNNTKKTDTDEEAKTEDSEETSIFSSVVETVTSAVETVAEAVVGGVEAIVSTVTGSDDSNEKTGRTGKRAEKVGIVASDKMTKTVTVRVDRLVKHPIYRKYIKRRKKFMAHDDLGAAIGDKVRIVETRPLSARKRWRVVEIIQKAER